jgi:hypothetical protein
MDWKTQKSPADCNLFIIYQGSSSLSQLPVLRPFTANDGWHPKSILRRPPDGFGIYRRNRRFIPLVLALIKDPYDTSVTPFLPFQTGSPMYPLNKKYRLIPRSNPNKGQDCSEPDFMEFLAMNIVKQAGNTLT